MFEISDIKIFVGEVGGMAGMRVQKVVLAFLAIGMIGHHVQFLELPLDFGAYPFYMFGFRMPMILRWPRIIREESSVLIWSRICCTFLRTTLFREPKLELLL